MAGLTPDEGPTQRNAPVFSISARLKSFSHALSGLGLMLRSQHNAWIHLLETAMVVAAGLWLKVGPQDWRWIVLAIALVWVAEIVNTAFEHLCDVVQPDFHVAVKAAKDVAAGAVLIAALAAAAIGVLVFLPYLST